MVGHVTQFWSQLKYGPISRVMVGGFRLRPGSSCRADRPLTGSAHSSLLFTAPCLERQQRISGKTTRHSANSRLYQLRLRLLEYAICWLARTILSRALLIIIIHHPAATSRGEVFVEEGWKPHFTILCSHSTEPALSTDKPSKGERAQISVTTDPTETDQLFCSRWSRLHAGLER